MTKKERHLTLNHIIRSSSYKCIFKACYSHFDRLLSLELIGIYFNQFNSYQMIPAFENQCRVCSLCDILSYPRSCLFLPFLDSKIWSCYHSSQVSKEVLYNAICCMIWCVVYSNNNDVGSVLLGFGRQGRGDSRPHDKGQRIPRLL